MKNILLYGLQRSGVNYLEALLLKNFRVSLLNDNTKGNHPLQKHFRLYEDKEFIPASKYHNSLQFNGFDEYLHAMQLAEKVDGILVVSKDPYSWLLSYEKWVQKCKYPEVVHHYIQEYNAFYKKWIEFAQEDNRIKFVDYTTLLGTTKEELLKVKNSLNLKWRWIRLIFGSVNEIADVPQSTQFNAQNVDYYLNQEYLKEYSSSTLRKVNSLLDKELVAELNYSIIDVNTESNS